MAYTLKNLREMIQQDLDLISSNGSITRGDSFLPPSEIDIHIRRAVLDATALIHKLYEDYYLVPVKAINIVAGTASYAVPNDLYVNKIRRLLYDDGQKKYKIKRITNINETPCYQTDEDLAYIIVNELGVGYRLRFYPTPNFTSATNVTMWYIRRTKELLLDTDVLDIPEEFSNYVLANAKYRCLQKDIGNPMRDELKLETEEQKQLMITTLSNKVPDDETDLRPDYSFYSESIS